ncbi:hypothetical protein LBMAG15_07830 [Actinomycetes bacterium]|nr:hypothetical protein LBMAG15_07830 [Actinomycetes bacterium]
MKPRHVAIIALIAGALTVAAAALAAPAQAVKLVPSDTACTYTYKNGEPTTKTYACLFVAKSPVPAGQTATFTGTLSTKAISALTDWTTGANTVCLDRYPAKANNDSSMPRTPLTKACSPVKKNGTFTIKADLSVKGTYYYGLSMGPCTGSAALCGNGDPELVGVEGPAVVQLKTT